MSTRLFRAGSVLAALIFVVAACGPSTAPTAAPSGSAAASVAPASVGPSQPPPSVPTANLRWFCCLGTGQDPVQIPVEEEVAAGFATKYSGSSLKFEVTNYDEARDTLSTQIASGTAPDLVGPVGVGGLAAFQGQWLDLAPQIEKWSYDLSQFDPAAVDFYKVAEGQIGIPFAVYPSMLWYKADMFDEAGLEYPPHEYGAKYKMPDGTEVDWNYDTVLKLAKLLTVDKNGKDATETGFDPKSIVQYGFEPQRDDLRGLGAYWGAGSLAAADGKTVEVPDAWKTAWKFWYDGMWTNHTIMTGSVAESEEFSGGGYTFFSGRVAMSENFLWTTYGVADAGTDWDLAAIPSYNGTTTAPLNADTFGILKGSKNPDTAFAGLSYVLGDGSDKLLNLYGGMPARPDKQDAFFETLGKTEGFPDKVDWQVAKDSIQYADKPNFEAPMPKYNETLTILGKYASKFATTPGLNMDKEIEALRAEVQAAWDS
jgi:multiple sugar transport system substrate-binding protein